MRHNRALSWLTVAGLICGSLFVVAALFWTVSDLRYGRMLERELAALKAQGYPVTLAEVKPKPVPAELNAATIYVPLFDVRFDPQKSGYSKPTGQAGLNRFGIEKAEMPVALAARAKIETAAAQTALLNLRHASAMPYCVFPLRWEDTYAALFPHLAQFRQASRMVCTQALLKAHDGKLDEALDWIAVCYRMADQADGEPTLIAQLVGVAMRAIGERALQQILVNVDLQPRLARPLFEQLQKADLLGGWDAAMRMELVMGLTTMDKLGPKDSAALFGESDVYPGQLLRVLGSPVGRPVLKLEQANFASYMREALQQFAQPYRQGRGQLKETYWKAGFGRILTGIITPAFSRITAKRDQDLAATRMVQIVLALKAQRQSLGRYPEVLDALVWKCPTEDPFSGKPFVYWPEGKGFVLYSVGPNLQDDRGKAPTKPGNISEEGDMVWRCPR